jgi:hypothetical protein
MHTCRVSISTFIVASTGRSSRREYILWFGSKSVVAILYTISHSITKLQNLRESEWTDIMHQMLCIKNWWCIISFIKSGVARTHRLIRALINGHIDYIGHSFMDASTKWINISWTHRLIGALIHVRIDWIGHKLMYARIKWGSNSWTHRFNDRTLIQGRIDADSEHADECSDVRTRVFSHMHFFEMTARATGWEPCM